MIADAVNRWLFGESSMFSHFIRTYYTHPDLLSSEGRAAAAEVDAWLTDGSTRLPSAGGIKTRVRIFGPQ